MSWLEKVNALFPSPINVRKILGLLTIKVLVRTKAVTQHILKKSFLNSKNNIYKIYDKTGKFQKAQKHDCVF